MYVVFHHVVNTSVWQDNLVHTMYVVKMFDQN